MKKLIILNLALFLLSISAFSQDVQLSNNYEVKEGEKYDRFKIYYKKVYNWNNHTFLLNKTTKGFIVQKFDTNTLKEISKTDIKNVFNPKKERIQYLLQMDDKILVFIASKVKKSQILEIITISLEDLEQSSRKELLNTPGKLAETRDRNEYQVNEKYQFIKSNDNNTLIIEFVVIDKKTSQGKLVVNVFNKDLELVTKKEVNQDGNKNILVADRLLDLDNNYYLLGQIFTGGTRVAKERLEAYNLALYKLELTSGSLEQNDIDLGSEQILDEAKLHLSNDNKIKIVGTLRNYSAKDGLIIGKRKGEPTGLFVLDINDDGQTDNFTYHKFPVEMLEKNLRQKDVKKIKKKDKSKNFDSYFADLKIKRNKQDDKNETLILGEQQFITIEKVKDIHFEKYHFNNILAAKLLPDNSLKWMHKLIKFQNGRYKSDMSFNDLHYKNEHFVFFRENEKNLGVDQEEVNYAYVSHRGGYLAAYKVDDSSGNVEKDVVYYPEGTNAFQFLTTISENEMLYEQYLKKENRLVKISIN